MPTSPLKRTTTQPRKLDLFKAWISASALVTMTLASGWALAQTTPPIPLPRPDFLDGSTIAEPDTPETIAEVIEQSPQTALEATNLPSTPQIPQSVALQPRIMEGGAVVPNGVTWRIFSTVADSQGQLELVAKSESAVTNVSLPPGEYLLHAAFGHAQVSDTLLVENGTNSKTVILDAGALILESAVSGDFPIAANTLRYDVYSSGLDDERVAVVRDLRPGEMVHLNAGVYSVESRWGTINATVRADIRIEPGELTEATLFHKASQINLKLVSESGGEAIADVEWSVRDSVGSEIFSFFGAFPSLVLAEGEYVVLAKLGGNVFNRDFEVRAGGAQEVEVLTTVY